MSIEQFIENEVKSNDVVLFMKGTPQFPMCGFSAQVVQILDHVGASYKGLNVLDSDELRQGIKCLFQLADHPAALRQGASSSVAAISSARCSRTTSFSRCLPRRASRLSRRRS